MTIDDAVAFAVEEETASAAASSQTREKDPADERELEIARLAAAEMSSREIATKLFISERTVETHITNMFNKLSLNSRLQLARWLARENPTSQFTESTP